MKKDIEIPKVKDVYVAVVKEPEADSSEWNVYVINDSIEDLNIVIIVSHGFTKTKKTSTLRKKIDQLPKKSYAKFEIIQEDLFALTNEFKVSFFLNNRLYDKTFIFKPNSVSEENLKDVPLIEHKGILAE